MITETLLDRPLPQELLQERKLAQFQRAIMFDLGLDEYIKDLNGREGEFYDERTYLDFFGNLESVAKIIRFSVFYAYQDVLRYGSQENKNHAIAIIDLMSHYRLGQIDNIMVGGSASRAVEQIHTLVANFSSWDYQNKYLPR